MNKMSIANQLVSETCNTALLFPIFNEQILSLQIEA